MSHPGVISDQQRRVENLALVEVSEDWTLCDYCGGTGNEFYAMYRACPKCRGVGVVWVLESNEEDPHDRP